MKEAIDPTRELTISGGSMEKTGEKSGHAQRNALLCALIAGACLLASYPVAEMGIVDDPSYTKTALDFARTGHFVYNGWGAAMLGWQVVWGALFIKLFGFSFTIVRFSMLPVALASVYLLHQILVRFEIAPRLAVFGALTLGLSPLFIPLAASFMTDIPGLFVILACIYMCQRAVTAKSDNSALLWLCSAALLNVAGGTVRQIAWLGALVMVPSTAWLLRKRRGMRLAATMMWLASVAAIFWLLHWFSQQPYSASEAGLISQPLHAGRFAHLGLQLAKTPLCFLLVVLPIVIAWLPSARGLNRRTHARIAIFLLGLVLVHIFLGTHRKNHEGMLQGSLVPWLSHVIEGQFVTPSYMLGSSPATLGVLPRMVISLAVVAVGLTFAELLLAQKGARLKRFWPEKKRSSWQAAVWILGPFAASYLCLLLPRGTFAFIFDRYLLPLMAVAIIVLLKLYQEEFSPQLPMICWIALAIFAFYTVAATHDWFALDRARLLAANNVRQTGVPRTEIQGGIEYDVWTQIQDGGHVNDLLIRVPKGAYDPNVPPLPVAPKCRLGFASSTPAVRPKYFLTFEPMDCLAPSMFSPVHYRAWLPPFQRTVYIQQLPAGSK